MVPCPSPYQKREGIFLPCLRWEPHQAPGRKSYKIVGAPPWPVLPGVFNSQTRLHSSAVHQSQSRSTQLGTGSCSGSHHWASAAINQNLTVALSARLSSRRGWMFALCPPISYGSKKSHWVSSLFSFSLVVRTEGLLLNFLHVERERRSQFHLLLRLSHEW